MQLDVQQELAGNRIDPRIQPQSSDFVEITNHEKNTDPNRSLYASAVLGYVSRRRKHRDRRRRRNFAVLENVWRFEVSEHKRAAAMEQYD